VVDGIENLNPDYIESISVIKDPNDPLIKAYNAKDGLVMITSKDEKLVLTPKETKNIHDDNPPKQNDDDVFYIVEDMPKFPGGTSALKTYIYTNLEYPENAKKQGIEGEAVVRFLVTETGKVENSEVLRSSNQEFEAPALKVVKEMPDWTPGMQRGKAVKVWHVISIKFNDEKK
jgi:TonB family protein